MDISGLDFVLINIISYVSGLATGLIICCKNKDKILVKSRSLDNISSNHYDPPIVASAPPPIDASSVPAMPAMPAMPATNPPITKITLQ